MPFPEIPVISVCRVASRLSLRGPFLWETRWSAGGREELGPAEVDLRRLHGSARSHDYQVARSRPAAIVTSNQTRLWGKLTIFGQNLIGEAAVTQCHQYAFVHDQREMLKLALQIDFPVFLFNSSILDQERVKQN